MIKQDILDNFGRILISNVRDEVLTINESILNGKMGSKESQNLYRKIENCNDSLLQFLSLFSRDIVDRTLHHFLAMIEHYEEMELIFQWDKAGTPVGLSEISDGLCGELYTEKGWIKLFSKYPSSIE